MIVRRIPKHNNTPESLINSHQPAATLKGSVYHASRFSPGPFLLPLLFVLHVCCCIRLACCVSTKRPQRADDVAKWLTAPELDRKCSGTGEDAPGWLY